MKSLGLDKATLAAAGAAGAYGAYSAKDGDDPFMRGVLFAMAGGTLGHITPGYKEAFNEFASEATKAYKKGIAEANAKVPLL